VIILHKTIGYAGPAAPSTLIRVSGLASELVFTDDPETGLSRSFGREITAAVTQPAGRNRYRLAFPDALITGSSDDSAVLAARFLVSAVQEERVDWLGVPVTVRYAMADGQAIGSSSLDVIVLPALPPPSDVRSTHVPVPDFHPAYFFADRAAWTRLRARLTELAGDTPVLAAICYLTEVVDGVPTFSEDIAALLTAQLNGVWPPEKIDAVMQALRQGHADMTDIRLTIPVIETLVVAGTLTVVAPDGVTVIGQDLAAFELAAEWTGTDGRPRSRRFRFDPAVQVDDGSAPFVLTGGVPVLIDGVTGQVQVSVRGPDGVTLWTRDYEPADADLADLAIKVPLQATTPLVPPDTAPVDANLRLRGRVLLSNRACKAKDLLVIVKTKAAAGEPWRVVGAAVADDGGNFGMPYPYGTFVAAQATCTAAPQDAADIPIVADSGDRTISPDFLYLLINNELPNRPCDNCQCGVDTAKRLPDFADLIGSDTYSQDIGGSCVNLSKPNRTINEYAYQAVVRVSDPDVAGYRLIRREDGLETIDVTLAAALAGGAATLNNRLEVALAAAQQVLADTGAAYAARIVRALERAMPHARTVSAALQSGRPITSTVLADSRNHAEAVTATLNAEKTALAADDLPYLQQADVAEAAATGMATQLTLAIDTVGTAVHYDLVGDTVTRTRQPVALDNLINWQDVPGGATELVQAVSVATGHILHYQAQFKADGYSLGDLLYSLPLAPGQKKEIVVLDATQSLIGAETQQLTQNERLAMGLLDERIITSRLAGSVEESLSGRSTANTSGLSFGFGTGGQGYGSSGAYGGSGSAVLGVAGGTAKASSNASQNSSRDVAQFFGEKLRQSILQNAEGYRQLNASVVTTVQQGERFGVTSEVIANHNHCHSLTMMYFEVLRHYAIFQELVSAEECVFVPLPLARFTVENVGRWRDVLAPALMPLPSSTYLETRAGHPLVKAFDAVERIRTHYANIDYPAGSYDQEPIRFMRGTLQLRVSLPRPKTRYDRVRSLPIETRISPGRVQQQAKEAFTDAVLAGITGGFSVLFTGPPGSNINPEAAMVEGKQAIFNAFVRMDANFERVPPARSIRVVNFDPGSITANGVTVNVDGLDFFEDGVQDRRQWEIYSKLLGYSNVLDFLTYYFQGRLIAEWDEIFQNDIAPLVFDKIVDSLRLTSFAADFTAGARYTGGERVIGVTVSATGSSRRDQLAAQLSLSVSNNTAKDLRRYVTLTVEDVRLDYSTAHFEGPLYRGRPVDDLLDNVRLDIPERVEEKRNPRREDRYLAAALIDHLNSNLEHYNKVLWSRLDPDRRYMLLDGFGIQVYEADGKPVPGPAGVRSLASVVKNEVLTVAGNSLVLPVAPGYRVNGNFVQVIKPGETTVVTLFDHYKPLTPVEPYRVSVPTNGLFVEAVMGACNACEKIETDRVQDWDRFGTDEPTPIAPVTVPAPSLQNYQPAYRDFATPIVNVQTAPAAPAPGAGFAGLNELLAASGIFKDITGLDANQQNVIRTYLSNQENAKAFGEMAKEMAMQSHNTQNSGKILSSISGARTDGTITQDDASKLTKDHLQQQIDGGSAKRAQQEAEAREAAKPLTEALVSGVGQGKSGSGVVTSSAGTTAVNIGEAVTPGRLDVSVPGTVPRLRQDGDKDKDCWAVCTAMMVAWKKNQTITVEDAVGIAGEKYRDMYLNDTGLYAEDKVDYLDHQQLQAREPASYPLDQYVSWLRTYGPLWITQDTAPGKLFSPHALVLIRIFGAGTPDGAGTTFTLIDPRTGTTVDQTFDQFRRRYEEVATDDNASVPLRPQVVHFGAPIATPEGFKVLGPFNYGKPVHENVTLAALRGTPVTVPDGVTVGSDQATNEFLRGLFWNDDPEVLLFDEDRKTNWNISSGFSYGQQFTAAESASQNNLRNLTGRSHFFDLQFLHAMAEKDHEAAEVTKAKVMLWLEIIYKLSTGEGVAATDRLNAITIKTTVGGEEFSLGRYFTDQSAPRGTDTIGYLLTRDSKCKSMQIPRRAIGALLHTVQDSYAYGHVRRTLLNPSDQVDGSIDNFKPGTYAKLGAVKTFHTYRGQDDKKHGKYDLPTNDLVPSDLATFNTTVGARDAIEASRPLLTMWHAKKPWAGAGGPREYLADTVFKLDAEVTESNHDV
jgi:hypothetical protein